jgi:hypothetical protein
MDILTAKRIDSSLLLPASIDAQKAGANTAGISWEAFADNGWNSNPRRQDEVKRESDFIVLVWIWWFFGGSPSNQTLILGLATLVQNSAQDKRMFRCLQLDRRWACA